MFNAGIKLSASPKAYSLDQDKAISPLETVRRVRERLAALPLSILAHTTRIDNNRLGIPVFLSVCGDDARQVMPTRKQMGKGASPEQAEASALMELMERYGFFSFWERLPGAIHAPWSKAEKMFGDNLIPISEICEACHDAIPADTARKILELRAWTFVPCLRVADGKSVFAPLDLFKMLGEFNGSSAGNTDVESLLQGACELVERHVCCIVDRERPVTSTISQSRDSLQNPLLLELLEKFTSQGIQVILKDFSLGMPVPTVAAIAWDPTTFPDQSEIVFTAGSATSPVKAAIRALTEVAQLAGDFNSNACYEASGLPKFGRLEELEPFSKGPVVPLHSLPSIESNDMLVELQSLAEKLRTLGYDLYAVSTTNPETQVPTHYCFVPGFHFRERDSNASLGMFTGRMISEEATPGEAENAFAELEKAYPDNHFLPFYRGMLALRQEKCEEARDFFLKAEALQPDNDSRALAAFYHAYSFSLDNDWHSAVDGFGRAVRLCPDMKEYRNMFGVCLFKLGRYAEAAGQFQEILDRLDKGSVMDIQNLGMCYKELGKIALARHFLQAALVIDPGLDRAREALETLAQEWPHD